MSWTCLTVSSQAVAALALSSRNIPSYVFAGKSRSSSRIVGSRQQAVRSKDRRQSQEEEVGDDRRETVMSPLDLSRPQLSLPPASCVLPTGPLNRFMATSIP